MGRLPDTPYDDPRDAPSYLDAAELLTDERIDAVAVDPALSDLLPALRAAGLLVLLPEPLLLDPALLRAAREVVDAPDLAVALTRRWEPWTQVVASAAPLAGPPRQVTVRGWPRGGRESAELVDLTAGWCGEVLSVSGGGAVPVAALPDGAQVSWSLLTASGATVLVSHDGAPQGSPLVRLTFGDVRLDAGPKDVRWEGGEAMRLPTGAVGRDPGLVLTAAALLPAVGGGEVVTDRWPWPADLGDLQATGHVLRALRESARTGAPVRTT